MARIAKNGVKYINLDCNFFDKEKMFLVEERFGEVGMLRALRLMMYLYETEGCYLEWGEGSAYYFAKKVLGKSDAAEQVASLVSFLIEIGFFEVIHGEENGEKKTYLSSEKIVKDWIDIIQHAKRKVNRERVPDCVILAYATQFTKVMQINKIGINSEVMPINSEVIPLNSEVMQQPNLTNNKQTNKQTSGGINSEVIAETADDTRAEKPHAAPPFAVLQNLAENTEPPAVFAAAREAVLNTCYFRGISRGLVDAAAWCVAEGWITERGLRNIRRKADAKVELFRDTQGRRGHEEGWEVVRECVALVIREHGYEPPEYSRLDPEPPPAKPAKAERMTAGC